MTTVNYPLRNGELLILQRALRMYIKFYQEQAAKEPKATLRTDLKARVAAADALFAKLRETSLTQYHHLTSKKDEQA